MIFIVILSRILTPNNMVHVPMEYDINNILWYLNNVYMTFFSKSLNQDSKFHSSFKGYPAQSISKFLKLIVNHILLKLHETFIEFQ